MDLGQCGGIDCGEFGGPCDPPCNPDYPWVVIVKERDGQKRPVGHYEKKQDAQWHADRIFANCAVRGAVAWSEREEQA